MTFKITEKTFKEAVNRVAETDDGKILFAWLCFYCFHNGTALDKESLEKTYANAAVQNIYKSLRQIIKTENLRKIEFDYILSTEGKDD